MSDHLNLSRKYRRRTCASAKTHLGLTDLIDTSLDISDDQVVQRGLSRERVTQVDKRLEEVDQGRVRGLLQARDNMINKSGFGQDSRQIEEGGGKVSDLLDLGTGRVTFESRGAATASGMPNDDHYKFHRATRRKQRASANSR